jgi:outer membrane lipoprotein-sorting protein
MITAVGLPPPQEGVDGTWVAERVEERDVGSDGRLEMEMRLYDHRDRETLRRMVVLTRRDRGLDRLLVRFTFPGDLRDTGFLSVETDDGDDERFLFLPSLGRSRRISAQEKQDPFVGSDLTYEDLSGRRLEDYHYRLVGEERVDGHDGYVLESTAKDGNGKYPRSLSWVDKDLFIIRRGELYDRAGEKAKEFRAERIEEIDGIWTARRLTMRDLKRGTRTELDLTSVSYDDGIPARAFTRRALEQEGAR